MSVFCHGEEHGLTKREEFAKAAMQGLLAWQVEDDGTDSNLRYIADTAVKQADELIKALNK